MQLFTWLRTLTWADRPFAGRTTRKPPRPRPLARRRPVLEALEDRVVPSTMAPDSLYVGDNATNGHSGDNSVQRFDAATGAGLGTFVAGSDSLKGVRGLIFDGNGHMLVANQDVGRGKPGEILRYDAQTGAFQGELVPFQDPNAPFSPRGMVLKGNVLYVANLSDGNATKAGIAPDGEVDRYDATTGAFQGALTRPANWVGQFNPRAVVFGPDGKLYVSVFDSSNLSAGYVVKYDVATNAGSIFAFNNGDSVANLGETADLHRPEGLTFGPDGNLYVTGYRADASDTDKIVILNTNGVEVNSIALDAVGQARAYGQGILFGPGGHLFMPISTLNSPDTGAIRSYDVTAKTFTNFEPPGTLGSAWYLTFGNTDSATLAYHTGSAASSSAALDQVAAAAALAQPLSTPAASTVPPTLPGGPQAGSVAPSGSSAPSVTGTISSVMPTASASPTGATDRWFAAWADDLFVDALLQ